MMLGFPIGAMSRIDKININRQRFKISQIVQFILLAGVIF